MYVNDMRCRFVIGRCKCVGVSANNECSCFVTIYCRYNVIIVLPLVISQNSCNNVVAASNNINRDQCNIC